MENKDKKYRKVKSVLRNAAIIYTVLGSLYMLTVDTTGHRSADIYLGKSQPTNLEKYVSDFISDRLPIQK